MQRIRVHFVYIEFSIFLRSIHNVFLLQYVRRTMNNVVDTVRNKPNRPLRHVLDMHPSVQAHVRENLFSLCYRGRIKDVTLSWAASDPPPDVLFLAQTGDSFSQYIAESSRDYIQTFMASKDNITKGIFSLACGHSKSGTVRPDPSCLDAAHNFSRIWSRCQYASGL